MSSGVDWNDFIGDFIKLKAQKPHLLIQMIKREEDYHRMKQSQRNAKQQAIKYQNLTSQLQNQISSFNKVKLKKQKLIEEMNAMDRQMHEIQAQIIKQKQASIKMIKKARADLISSRRMQKQKQSNIRKDIANLTTKCQNQKNELKQQLSCCVAQRVHLKQQLQQVRTAYNTLKSNQANIKKARQKLDILKAKNVAARQKRSSLHQQHKKWLTESQKSPKKHKLFNEMFQQGKRNIKQAFKEMKKFLIGDHSHKSKKYEQFINKMSKYRPINRSVDLYKQLERQYHYLSEKHRAPPFYQKNKIDFQQMIIRVRQTMELEDIQQSFIFKNKTQQEIAQFYQSYDTLETYLKQRIRMQQNTDHQIQSRKAILQKKTKDIELSKERIKELNSI